MSGLGGTNFAVTTVNVFAQALERLGIAAQGDELAYELAFRSIDEVMASEAARFDRMERADGSAWTGPQWRRARPMPLRRKGDLRASMSTYYLAGPVMRGAMAPHGRYHNPPDYWPSPLPKGVKDILIRNANKMILDYFGSVAAARGILGSAW